MQNLRVVLPCHVNNNNMMDSTAKGSTNTSANRACMAKAPGTFRAACAT